MAQGTFAVIGDPIDHSLSPNIHSAAFRELGMDCSYIAYRVPAGELAEGVEGLRRTGIRGYNVTVPHKVGMMRYLDRTDESCSLVGAANTVEDRGGSLRGHNTDMDGFLEPLKKRGVGIAGARVLLLGAGGAARAAVAGLAREGAGRLTVANRTERRAAELAAFSERLGLAADTAGIADAGAAGHDIIVNATTVGMRGEPSPVRLDGAGPGTVVYDMVYRPMETGLVREARGAGADVVMGYEMLLAQAARSFEIWHGTGAPHAAMKRALLGGA